MKSQEYLKRLRNVILIASLAMPPIHGSAESLTNEDGVVYENVTVVSVTPKDLLITYQSNSRRSAISIPLKSLPQEVQQRYGYDPGKEDTYKAEMARKDAANAVMLAHLRQAQVRSNSIPQVTNVLPPTGTDKPSTASPSPTVVGGLTDEEIKQLNASWTDSNSGTTYFFMANMSRGKPSANEQKRYVESGKVPFTISVQFRQQLARQKNLTQITEGRAHFYIFDSDGNVIVEPRTDDLLKLCRH
jgi:hypothetical protein